MTEKETNTVNPMASNQETTDGTTASKGKYDHLTPEEMVELISNVPAPVMLTKTVVITGQISK